MKRRYKLPIMGKVLEDNPPKGDPSDPLCVVPFYDLPDFPVFLDARDGIEKTEPFSYIPLEYNIDEEWCEIELEGSEVLHQWLLDLTPTLRDIAKTKGWKLDKTELEKVRQAMQG